MAARKGLQERPLDDGLRVVCAMMRLTLCSKRQQVRWLREPLPGQRAPVRHLYQPGRLGLQVLEGPVGLVAPEGAAVGRGRRMSSRLEQVRHSRLWCLQW